MGEVLITAALLLAGQFADAATSYPRYVASSRGRAALALERSRGGSASVVVLGFGDDGLMKETGRFRIPYPPQRAVVGETGCVALFGNGSRVGGSHAVRLLEFPYREAVEVDLREHATFDDAFTGMRPFVFGDWDAPELTYRFGKDEKSVLALTKGGAGYEISFGKGRVSRIEPGSRR